MSRAVPLAGISNPRLLPLKLIAVSVLSVANLFPDIAAASLPPIKLAMLVYPLVPVLASLMYPRPKSKLEPVVRFRIIPAIPILEVGKAMQEGAPAIAKVLDRVARFRSPRLAPLIPELQFLIPILEIEHVRFLGLVDIANLRA